MSLLLQRIIKSKIKTKKLSTSVGETLGQAKMGLMGGIFGTRGNRSTIGMKFWGRWALGHLGKSLKLLIIRKKRKLPSKLSNLRNST